VVRTPCAVLSVRFVPFLVGSHVGLMAFCVNKFQETFTSPSRPR
jgi:hypothetical protein